jgi:hypothetical protein
LNAVLTRTSPSSQSLTFEQPAACRTRAAAGRRGARNLRANSPGRRVKE